MSDFSLTILGCNSAVPAYGRFPTAQILKHHKEHILIDCGEGTQFQFNKYHIKRAHLNYIFISHLHGDHYFGLVGLLHSFRLNGRTSPLHIFGPKELEAILLLQVKFNDEEWGYPIHFYPHTYSTSYLLTETKNFKVYSIPLQHRIPCNGFLFVEKPKLRKINSDTISQHNVPFTYIPDLREGKDFVKEDGRVIPNELLTFNPPKSKSYAFCSDTEYDEAKIDIIKGVDLLYHEATYLHKNKDKARKWHHSTTVEAATIAKKAAVGKLILGHYSAKYKDLSVFKNEAQHVFPNTDLAIEGKTFII